MDLTSIVSRLTPTRLFAKYWITGNWNSRKQRPLRKARKNQHSTELKQVQLTPQIGQHDLETKARHAREFLEDGDKVEVCVVFVDLVAHKEVGEDVMEDYVDQLADISIIDKEPYWEGKWYNAILTAKEK